MLTSVVDASNLVLNTTPHSLGTEQVPLGTAAQRVLAADVYTDRAYPPYDRVMMDGICYSSCSKDSSRLQIVGTLHAGDASPTALQHGQAWRINTGAALPPDCDLIVPVEELAFSGDTVSICTDFQPKPYQFVHRSGSDRPKGEVVLPSGTLLDSASLSIAVSVGQLQLTVHRAPKVFILTTGQEAIPPHQQPAPHQIRRSHPTALTTALQRLGITEISHLHLSDHADRLKAALLNAMESADVILTCGAISKGTSDYLGAIFRELLGAPAFHGVAQRPGKPLAYWTPHTSGLDKTPLAFALPGNALSTLITFHRYVAPALRQLMGNTQLPAHEVSVQHALPPFHLTRFLPVSLSDTNTATLLSPQNSGDFSSLAGSNGFVECPVDLPHSPVTLPFYAWL